MDPLYSVVDPDALDQLFSSKSKNADREGCVFFPFEGYQVFVHSDGQLVLHLEDTARER